MSENKKKNESSSEESAESSSEESNEVEKKPTESKTITEAPKPAKKESSAEEEAESSEDDAKEKKVKIAKGAKKTERTQSPVTSPRLRKGMSRTKTGMPSKQAIQQMIDPFRYEARLFYALLFAFEVAIIIIYAIWADYDKSGNTIGYGYTRDVNIMIFFGFGFLMCFLRRYAYSAIGYTFLVSAMVAQWSMFLQALADWEKESGEFHIGIFQMVNGLFCAGAVMISYGALLGKVTPVQMLLLAIIEPLFYWVNIYVTINKLEVVDIGGGMTIHTFGAYFGLATTWFLTSYETRSHKDNTNAYNADIFSLAGTLFLWIMWPSFNAAVADTPQGELRALINTFLSITASVLSSFLVSRIVSENRFDVVHIQNSTLAGGVAMGVAAHLNIQPAGAIGCGFLAGIISVWGYKYLTPVLSKKLNVQDVCGINNLHGMPGILSCLIGIFAALTAARNTTKFYPDPAEYTHLFPQGDSQAGYQTAGLFITLGIALVGGCVTGFILMLANRHNPITKSDFFNDRTFWNLPTDYEYNIYDKQEEDAIEMKEVNA